MGTPIFAAKVLEMLVHSPYQIVGVISQPNRRTGRKRVETLTPVRTVADMHHIPCMQPEKIIDAKQWICDLNPDLLLTCAYGQIVSTDILSIPKEGCLNLHASLLPKYRGGAPIQYAILNGDTKTGITLMEMVKKMDAGDIYDVKEVEISSQDTQATVYVKLEGAAQRIVSESLPLYFNKELVPITQDENKVTYAYNIQREQERIDVTKDGQDIYNQIRALNPIPGAYLYYNDTKIKLFDVRLHKTDNDQAAFIKQFDKNGLMLNFKGYDIEVLSLQVEGKKHMTFIDFYPGNSNFFAVNDILL